MKIDKKEIILIIVISLLIAVSIITYIFDRLIKKDINNFIERNTNLIKENITIEYGDTYNLKDLINDIDKNINSKFYINDKLINQEYLFDKVGDIKLNIELETKYKTKYLVSKKINFYKIINIKVKDTNKPIIDGLSKKTITIGDSLETIKKEIKAYDKVDGELEFIIDGTINNNKIGTYKVNVISKDKNNNETKEILEVEVKQQQGTSTIVGKTSKGYDIIKKDGIYYINGTIIANKTYPLPSSYNPGKLTPTFNNAYNKMKEAASNDGIKLSIVSGYRSYQTQKSLYNNYVNRDGKTAADTYSARPGHSEHQLGLAADLITASSNNHFENTKEYEWLKNNCYKYGFILRYLEGKENITGYKFEPWHYRYVGESLATKLYNNGNWITLEEYFGITSKY